MNYRIDIDDSILNRAAGIKRALQLANEAIAARNAALPVGSPTEPLFTEQTYLEFLFLGVVDSWTTDAVKSDSGRIALAFEKATPEQKASVKTLLDVVDLELASVKLS
ncbi:MAG: hypothetical protein HOO67_06040 [Candidatus Peribacteraceae bacterium]|nr:hypothetical protein [Candidatus Peribacteraceae bacterium]